MANLKLLSPDAYFLGCSLFSMMEPEVGTLTFGMRESRPTQRTQNALDELVKAKCARVEPFNDFGGVVYTVLVKFPRPTERLAQRAGRWPITEALSKGSD